VSREALSREQERCLLNFAVEARPQPQFQETVMARTKKGKDQQPGQPSEKNHEPQVDQGSRDREQSPDAGAGGRAGDQDDTRKPESDEEQLDGSVEDEETPKNQPKRYQP